MANQLIDLIESMAVARETVDGAQYPAIVTWVDALAINNRCINPPLLIAREVKTPAEAHAVIEETNALFYDCYRKARAESDDQEWLRDVGIQALQWLGELGDDVQQLAPDSPMLKEYMRVLLSCSWLVAFIHGCKAGSVLTHDDTRRLLARFVRDRDWAAIEALRVKSAGEQHTGSGG